MMAHPAAASAPLNPGPVPPPVAGAPAGAPVVVSGTGDVVVPVAALADVLGLVAAPVGDAVPARASGQSRVPVAVLAGVAVEVAGVHALQCGWVPLASGSQAIGVPFSATPDMFRSALGQNSPAL
jgi:hypothetical protein